MRNLIKPAQTRLYKAVVILVLLTLVAACDMAIQPAGTPAVPPNPTGLTTPTRPPATEVTPTGSGASVASVTATLGNNTQTNPAGSIPERADKPAPPPNTYKGCPASGDGGDRQLNARKNRVDTASWYPVSIASILALRWPSAIEGQPRFSWSVADAAEVARYDGIPVQVEGYLAGAKQQGPESCNCHSVNDVDNHLWIVDSPGKTRAESVVVEVTPRVRAGHPGWALSRIRPLVDGRTKVRISGWLLMDQEHPDQIGKTRGTIWEIHPIIAFDVLNNGAWTPLDAGDVSSSYGQPGGAAAQPTEDPNLPPPLSDPIQTATIPTPTPAPTVGSADGQSTTGGQVQITDIFFNGVKGSNEPDEYVEITNRTTAPLSLNGWVLRDLYGPERFTFNNYTLPAGGKIRIYTNETHAESGGFSFGSRTAIWSNKGDAAELVDGSGAIASTFAYGDKK